MLNKPNKFALLLSLCVCFIFHVNADDLSDLASNIVKSRVSSSAKFTCTEDLICSSSHLLAQFYKSQNYNLVWIESGKLTPAGQSMVGILRTAYSDGLNPTTYHVKQINSLLSQLNSADDKAKALADLDLTISDGFLLYANNMYYGMIDIKKMYPYWNGIKKPIDLTKQLELAIANPKDTVQDLAPVYAGYAKLKDKLADYQEIDANGGWETIPDGDTLQVGDKGDRVKALRERLLISGELQTSGGSKFNDELQKAVIQFQENNGLYDDGIVESDTLAMLNIPVRTRIRQIELNMDKMRLLPSNLGKDYLFVNLPAYSLTVVRDNQPFMTMDVAVGGTEHPSCVLNSKIQYLVLNPYWNIPYKIAESEIWASVKSDPDYLKNKHVQVLKPDGKGGYKVINPEGFNWNKMTARQFDSYRYRQSPGEQNALGKVKFIFPNACGIYLHDTNESELFDVYARDFSHGCIRVSQPLNLTTFILNSQKQWSSKKVSNMFQNDVNKTVQLVRPFNLYIMYLTSFVSNDDWVQFRNDIYHLDKQLSNYSGFKPRKKVVDTQSDDN